MKATQIELVRNSWALVAGIGMETVGGLFYNRLFEIMPEVKPMFSRTTLPEQSKKLLMMLSYIIAKLDRLEDIVAEIGRLAQNHVKYGVREDHYVSVGAALLWTLEQGLGEHWNPELKDAWVAVYTVLSGAMIAAAQYETAETIAA